MRQSGRPDELAALGCRDARPSPPGADGLRSTFDVREEEGVTGAVATGWLEVAFVDPLADGRWLDSEDRSRIPRGDLFLVLALTWWGVDPTRLLRLEGEPAGGASWAVPLMAGAWSPWLELQTRSTH